MRILNYKIDENLAGITVESFLKKHHGYSSRTIIKLKHYSQGMQINNAHARTIDILKSGDTLKITFLDQNEHGIDNFIRSNFKVEIPYEDDDIIVFNKPSGMPCHQSCGHVADTLANVFAAHCDTLGLNLMYRPLNRIDRDTSGAVLVAKNRYVAASISGKFDKIYQAVLCGIPPQMEGRVDLPIRREAPEEMRRIIADDGQPSVTNYRVIAAEDGYSLCNFVLETGRTHQIRVHMAALGCPILGDPMYGKSSDLIARQALHCLEVSFLQPVTREWINVFCKEPEDILSVKKKLKIT